MLAMPRLPTPTATRAPGRTRRRRLDACQSRRTSAATSATWGCGCVWRGGVTGGMSTYVYLTRGLREPSYCSKLGRSPPADRPSPLRPARRLDLRLTAAAACPIAPPRTLLVRGGHGDVAQTPGPRPD